MHVNIAKKVLCEIGNGLFIWWMTLAIISFQMKKNERCWTYEHSEMNEIEIEIESWIVFLCWCKNANTAKLLTFCTSKFICQK